MIRILAIAGVALALNSAPAHAQDVDQPTAKVTYADLDLSNAQGQATLVARISRAIDVVCGERPAPMELDRMAAYDHCRTTARASADRQMAALTRGDRLSVAAVEVRSARR